MPTPELGDTDDFSIYDITRFSKPLCLPKNRKGEKKPFPPPPKNQKSLQERTDVSQRKRDDSSKSFLLRETLWYKFQILENEKIKIKKKSMGRLKQAHAPPSLLPPPPKKEPNGFEQL